MSASRLYPKMYRGREESGGYIARNETRKAPNSPHYRGRFYLAGIGWYWVAGWFKKQGEGEVVSISIKEMTDDDARQYCAPRRKAEREMNDPEPSYKPERETDSDIPF